MRSFVYEKLEYRYLLLEAVARSDFEAVKIFIKAGANINQARALNNAIALHLAADNLNSKLIGFLINKNASLNRQDINSEAPIHRLF